MLLNLLSNAKDALTHRKITPAIITITIDKNSISISDNAGGIKPELLSRVCEPYFTTKEGNSGIGLYMSKMIIERNIKGKLKIKNALNGLECSIFF